MSVNIFVKYFVLFIFLNFRYRKIIIMLEICCQIACSDNNWRGYVKQALSTVSFHEITLNMLFRYNLMKALKSRKIWDESRNKHKSYCLFILNYIPHAIKQKYPIIKICSFCLVIWQLRIRSTIKFTWLPTQHSNSWH